MKIDESIIWDIIMHNQTKLTDGEALELAKKIKEESGYFIYERGNPVLDLETT